MENNGKAYMHHNDTLDNHQGSLAYIDDSQNISETMEVVFFNNSPIKMEDVVVLNLLGARVTRVILVKFVIMQTAIDEYRG